MRLRLSWQAADGRPLTRTVTLGGDFPVRIGSDPERCAVRLDDVAPVLAELALVLGEPVLRAVAELSADGRSLAAGAEAPLPALIDTGDALITCDPVSESPALEVSSLEEGLLARLLPLHTVGHHLVHKGFLIPALITILVVVRLFALDSRPRAFMQLLAIYIGLAALYFVYRLCGKPRPWWTLALVCGATVALAEWPLTGRLVGLIFHRWLPGAAVAPDASLGAHLLSQFFGAGLPEELLKATPLLAMAAITPWLSERWAERIGLREPLDGVLLGAAAAIGFTWVETLGLYAPVTIERHGDLAALQLVIPRLLGSVAIHLAYSGYLGYCIGHGALDPRRFALFGAAGLLIAASLHALWNVSSHPLAQAAIAALAYTLLASAILEGRRVSPTREANFATRVIRRGL